MGLAVSPGDMLLWEGYELYGDGGIFLWDSATQTHEQLALDDTWPKAINDQKQIVGDLLEYDAERGYLGFLYEDGQVQTFHDLLPEKFKNQLRSAVPYLITNVNTETDWPTVTFSAECLKGDGEGEWIYRQFIWTKDQSGEPQVNEISTPPDQEIGAPTGVSIGGSFVAVMPAAIPKPAKGDPISFKAVDGLLMSGYDPLIPNDVGSGINSTTGQPQYVKDTAAYEWWTSVSRAGTLNVNDSIVVQFGKDEEPTAGDTIAAGYTILVDKNNRTQVAVTASGGMHSETRLRIQGLAGASATTKTETAIHVVEKEDARLNPDDFKPIRTIKVMVLPEQHVQLGIWHVTAPTQPNTANLTALPGSTPNAAKILSRLNETYRQACIVFDLDPASGPIELPYDFALKDGKLQTDVPTDAEYKAIFNSSQINPKLNLIIAKDIAKPTRKDTAGFCPVPGTSRKVIVFAQKFANDVLFDLREYSKFDGACAHEIGHALNLATRKDTSGGQHDPGAFPDSDMGADTMDLVYENARVGHQFYHRGALMHFQASTNRWIRHEDWQEANRVAGKIVAGLP